MHKVHFKAIAPIGGINSAHQTLEGKGKGWGEERGGKK